MRTHALNSTIALALLAVLISGCGGGSSNGGPQQFTQVDRIGRAEVSEICVTVANGEGLAYSTSTPTQDSTTLKPRISAFVTHAAGRSAGVASAAAALLSPDVLTADIGQAGPANFLDVELNPGGSKFGGRKFTDDVVTTDFTLFFGNTLGNDGSATPGLITDNVTANTAPKHYRDGSAGFGAAAFPYLGAPQ